MTELYANISQREVSFVEISKICDYDLKVKYYTAGPDSLTLLDNVSVFGQKHLLRNLNKFKFIQKGGGGPAVKEPGLHPSSWKMVCFWGP